MMTNLPNTPSARNAWKQAIRMIKYDYTIGGRASIMIDEVQHGYATPKQTLTIVRVSRPGAKNTLLNETYFVQIGCRGKLVVTCQGYSLGGVKKTLSPFYQWTDAHDTFKAR